MGVEEREITLTMRQDEHAKLVRNGVEVTLDVVEIALVRALADALAQDADRPESMRGFVRSTSLAHLAPMTPSPEHAVATIRHLAKRLERKLGTLGDPPLLEVCERRGYRLTSAVTLTR